MKVVKVTGDVPSNYIGKLGVLLESNARSSLIGFNGNMSMWVNRTCLVEQPTTPDSLNFQAKYKIYKLLKSIENRVNTASLWFLR